MQAILFIGAWGLGTMLATPVLVVLACVLEAWTVALMQVVHHLAYASLGEFSRSGWGPGASDVASSLRWLAEPSASWWAWLLTLGFGLFLGAALHYRRRERRAPRRPSGTLAAVAVGAALLVVCGLFVLTLRNLDYRDAKDRLVREVGASVFGSESFPHQDVSYYVRPVPGDPYTMYQVWTFTCDEAGMARVRAALSQVRWQMSITDNGAVQVVQVRE